MTEIWMDFFGNDDGNILFFRNTELLTDAIILPPSPDGGKAIKRENDENTKKPR